MSKFQGQISPLENPITSGMTIGGFRPTGQHEPVSGAVKVRKAGFSFISSVEKISDVCQS